MDAQIIQALENDLTIDIITLGCQSGQPRTTEIWFKRVNGRTFITGTPGKRDWYANLLKNPRFTFRLKESVWVELPAIAQPILDPTERYEILSQPQMDWYHSQVSSVAELVEGSPLVEVIFE